MNTSSEDSLDRLDVLLAESMIRPLDAEEVAEFEQLAGMDGSALLAEAEQAAVTLQLGYAEVDEVESMPEGLMESLKAQAPQVEADQGVEPAAAPTQMPAEKPLPSIQEAKAKRDWAPWLLAAAALLLIFNWLPQSEQTVAEKRLELIAAAPEDLLDLPWTILEDPSSEGADGSLLWSDERQEGYMLFEGLAPNDPTVEQYQLWIFDDATDTRFPVDGGVFDIPAGQDQVIIEIDPKILVDDAFQFAITVEKPGGVVVSDRERIPLLAAEPAE